MAGSANPQHLTAMHEAHGVNPDAVCGNCAHCAQQFASHAQRGTVSRRVCRKAEPGLSGHGKVLRRKWLITWQACGLFQER